MASVFNCQQIKRLGKNARIIQPVRRKFVHRKLHQCEECELINECTSPVQPSPGRYNIAIVGEAPGFEEDKAREGFVGRSGNKIWTILENKGYHRSSFHVTNVGKCYPSKSRKPNAEQIKICGQYLEKELEMVKPRVILSFGNTGLQFFNNQKSGILGMSGKIQWNERFGAWVVYCLHPAATSHNADNSQYYDAGMKNFCRLLRGLGLKKKVK